MHLIHQHNIEVSCNKAQLGKALKNDLSALLETKFYPKLERLLMDYDDTETVWTIEQLPIVLNNLNAKQWKTELIDQSLHQIETFLKINSSTKKHVGRIEQIVPISLKTNKKKHTETLLIKFLKTGILEVNAQTSSLEHLYETIDINTVFITKAKSALRGKIQAILRWSLNVPQHLKFEFLGVDGITHDFDFVAKAIDRSPKLNDFLEFLYWMSYFNEDISLFDKQILKNIKSIAKHYYNIEGNYVDTLLFQNDKKDNLDIKSNALDELLENEKIIITQKTALFIENAGLVLLHPYLPKLFSSLGYQEKGEWKDTITQHRAALVLQYLAGKNKTIFENQMLLNKLICGINLTDTLATKFKATKEEKDLCKSLLKTVIAHWKILKNTSVKGLQESFLQREGKLVLTKDDHYELNVENKSFDMLLDQLPWGIGMIKTPWMVHYINCNWR